MRKEAKKSFHSLYILANETPSKSSKNFTMKMPKHCAIRKQRLKLQGSSNISPLNDPKQ